MLSFDNVLIKVDKDLIKVYCYIFPFLTWSEALMLTWIAWSSRFLPVHPACYSNYNEYKRHSTPLAI